MTKRVVSIGVAMIIFASCQYDEIRPTTSATSTVLLKAAVKIAVGGVLYENLDATVTVKGYDASNTLKWMKNYELTGPADTIGVQNGFDHYSIELPDKWGINDIQAGISGKAVWDGRADGPLPVTYILGGSRNAKKLSSYVTSSQLAVPGNEIIYQPESRVLYEYQPDGRLEYVHHQTYNPQTSQFEETRTEAFIFDGDRVSKIMTTLNGQPYSEDHYEYGTKNKITETLHFDNDLVWTQTFTSSADSSNFRVDYNLSNSSTFSYDFGILYKNIVRDRTKQSDQLCNQGNYSYDKNINPFRHLGYMDFYLQNWSVNNKLVEHVDYLACSYPSLMPLSHEYTYDSEGYPKREITTYGTYPPQSSSYHTAIDFYYQ